MEKLLLKLAEQLDALDEASLMELWNTYAEKTYTFEPTKRWETAALVLCLIQAKHMKNQLFNHYWARHTKLLAPEDEKQRHPAAAPDFSLEKRVETVQEPCRILPFRPDPKSDN